VFQSPNFPYGYPDGQLCSWRITVSQNYVIRLKFTNFSLPTVNNGDVVLIYDGLYDNATLLGSYYGIRLPGDVTSSTNNLYLVFRSDGAWNGKGFRASYHSIDPKGIDSYNIVILKYIKMGNLFLQVNLYSSFRVRVPIASSSGNS